MNTAVHIVAVAARTPVGLRAPTTAAALRARISRLSLHPFLLDPSHEELRCARDGVLEPELLGPPRIQALAEAALRELFEDVRIRGEVPVLLALPEQRPGFGKSDATQLVRSMNARSQAPGAERTVRDAGTGHAGALRGIADAVSGIRNGVFSLCAVGGADSYFETDTLQWLDQERMLAHSGVRGGFPPGEGAAFVLLASDDARRSMRLPSLATVVNAAYAQETRTRASEEGFLGEALAQAITQASQSLAPPEQQITDVICDINGERMRTDDWGFALLRCQHMFRDASSYVSPIAEIGDVGAAWGALSTVLAVERFRRKYADGPRALVWGASWHGLRAACVLSPGGD